MTHQSLKVEYIPLADLIPYARNSRTHSDAQVAQIAASVREFGFTNPVLISPNHDIIAGHGRVLAARKLGLDKVPCIRLGHLTDTQRRAYVIADNRLAETSGWDMALLGLELEELHELNFDTTLLGFDDKQLDRYLEGDAEPEPTLGPVVTHHDEARPNEPTAPAKVAEGARELDPAAFDSFDQACPRCGFEFNG